MRRALVFLLFMVLPVFGMAATIHVPGDQPTIQAGIDAATDGDTVLVAPDTYVENINFLGKAITVTSELGPEVTIIDGSSPEDPDFGSVVTFWNDEGRDSILEGFTLTGGSGNYMSEGDQYFGGGISVAGSSPAVTGNIITVKVEGIGEKRRALPSCEFFQIQFYTEIEQARPCGAVVDAAAVIVEDLAEVGGIGEDAFFG